MCLNNLSNQTTYSEMADYQCKLCGVKSMKSVEMLLEHYYLHVKLTEFAKGDENGLTLSNVAFRDFVDKLEVLFL